MDWVNDFLDQIRGRKICVIGDVMLDRYLRGSVDRISPEAPVPILELKAVESRMGGAANVALNLAQLGCNVSIFGITGADEHGETLRNLIADQGIDASGIISGTDRPTTVKTRVIAGNQHILRIDEENASGISSGLTQQLASLIQEFLTTEKPDAVIFQDYNKGVLTAGLIGSVIDVCGKKDIMTAVDPKYDNFFAYKSVNLFKPNLRELRAAVPFKTEATVADLQRASDFLRKELGHECSCFTLGEKGLFLDVDGRGDIYPTHPREVVDVCGAGDAVISVVTLGYLLGLQAPRLAAIGNLAGGAVCEHVGVTALSRTLLQHELDIVRNL